MDEDLCPALAEAAQSAGDWATVVAISETVSLVLFMAFPIVGALITSRRPQNPIGWIRYPYLAPTWDGGARSRLGAPAL